MSIILGKYTPEWIWIPYTLLDIIPSDFMPTYYSGDQSYYIKSEAITDKVYQGYFASTGRIHYLVKVQNITLQPLYIILLITEIHTK